MTEIDGKYKCMGNTGYKQLLLLEYRDEKDSLYSQGAQFLGKKKKQQQE